VEENWEFVGDLRDIPHNPRNRLIDPRSQVIANRLPSPPRYFESKHPMSAAAGSSAQGTLQVIRQADGTVYHHWVPHGFSQHASPAFRSAYPHRPYSDEYTDTSDSDDLYSDDPQTLMTERAPTIMAALTAAETGAPDAQAKITNTDFTLAVKMSAMQAEARHAAEIASYKQQLVEAATAADTARKLAELSDNMTQSFTQVATTLQVLRTNQDASHNAIEKYGVSLATLSTLATATATSVVALQTAAAAGPAAAVQPAAAAMQPARLPVAAMQPPAAAMLPAAAAMQPAAAAMQPAADMLSFGGWAGGPAQPGISDAAMMGAASYQLRGAPQQYAMASQSMPQQPMQQQPMQQVTTAGQQGMQGMHHAYQAGSGAPAIFPVSRGNHDQGGRFVTNSGPRAEYAFQVKSPLQALLESLTPIDTTRYPVISGMESQAQGTPSMPFHTPPLAARETPTMMVPPPRSSNHSSRLPQPAKFSGKYGELVEDHIFAFESFLRGSHIPVEEWPSHVMPLLTGYAHTTWIAFARNKQTRGETPLWTDMVKVLSDSFGRQDSKLIARRELHAVSQTRSVADFVQRIRVLISQAGDPAPTDADMLLIFYNGLKSEIRGQSRINPRTGSFWTSFEELVGHTLTLDMRITPHQQSSLRAVGDKRRVRFSGSGSEPASEHSDRSRSPPPVRSSPRSRDTRNGAGRGRGTGRGRDFKRDQYPPPPNGGHVRSMTQGFRENPSRHERQDKRRTVSGPSSRAYCVACENHNYETSSRKPCDHETGDPSVSYCIAHPVRG
jgi:hypothetical protein